MIEPRQTEQRIDTGRRDFLRLMSSGAAVSVLGLPLADVWARAMRAEPLTIGLIGCGGRGTGAAIQALKADPNVRLWAMGDVFAERLDDCRRRLANVLETMDDEEADAGTGVGKTAWMEKLDVPDERSFVGFDAYRQVIGACDVVLLTTPPAFRPEHLRAAVEAGRHCFCEKPVAVDAPGVRSVLESARLAREKRLSLMSGFCWRYSARERDTYRALHAGRIGAVRAVYTTYNTNGWVRPNPRRQGWTDAEFQLRNWQYFVPLSGDHVVEQAVHAIDKLKWAMNDRVPVSCTGVGGREVRPELPETGNAWDHFSATFHYQDGVKGFHMCRHWPNTASDNADYIVTSQGHAYVNGWKTHGGHRLVAADGTEWHSAADRNDMYQQEHDELFASIRADRPVNDGQSMCDSTMMAVMARTAAYTGGEVTWAQMMSTDQRQTDEAWSWGSRSQPEIATPGRRPAG